MPSCRPATHEKPLGIKPEFGGALGKKRQRLTNLPNDVAQTRLGAERVAGQGDVKAARERPLGHAAAAGRLLHANESCPYR